MIGDRQIGMEIGALAITGSEQVLCEESGFLLAKEPPLVRLPLTFEPWELLVDDLQRLILASQIRARVLEVWLLSWGLLEHNNVLNVCASCLY